MEERDWRGRETAWETANTCACSLLCGFRDPGAPRGQRDFPGLAGTLDAPGGEEDRVAPAEEPSESQTPSRLPGGGPASCPPGAGPARAVLSAGSGLDSRARAQGGDK